MSSIGNFATLIVNDCDFARFARRPKDALWSQLIAIPTCFAVTSFIGIIVSSSSTAIYGQPIWDPLDILAKFIDNGSSAERFGVFAIALAFSLAQLAANIAANSVSAGSDLTALLPRSSNFTTYLSAYSVFLSSIAGVMATDYYIVRKGYLEVRGLYDARKSGPYYYTMGVTWRAYPAYFSGILVTIVGFAGAVGQPVPVGAIYLYNVNFFCGFIVSSIIYWALCTISPVPAVSTCWMEVGDVDDVDVAYDAKLDNT
ncbi:uracil permease [Purpureocillium takamizusanense]|uniref:Uracil permease n=1 Tax=Purpureocillium takamizusanense TaxID=2060973 RepID=A0A9Q8QDL8_9HYPO|nr:uracil permease [Purpureocillium takamizusanense]UNI17024.1 uracil permease [Purpureocillium takamizusanense]